jgi:Bacterial Ig-like domain
MNGYRDPELDDVLQDEDLRRIATMLSSATTPEPPLDEAFRTGLRRQLMNEAWAMTEGRTSWLRRAFAPPGLAWAGAAAGLVLIASAVVYASLSSQVGFSTRVQFASPQDGNRSVALQQPILVAFNQPMDHESTQNAVQITPATNVTFSWQDDSRTLAVQPAGGTLAPNTQYQVKIGSGARTAAGKPLSSSQTITFVTQPPPTPSASPTPRATPLTPLNEHQLSSLAGATNPSPQWSSDSSSVYFVDGSGALKVASLKGGAPQTIAPDGASSPSISLTGDRLAYIRNGKIEVLTFDSGKTDELTVTPAPVLVAWGKDKLLWAADGGIFTLGVDGNPQQVAALPTTGAVKVVAVAPDGAHTVYTQDQNLFVIDLASGKSVQLGQAGAAFQDWSPGGTQLLYSTPDNVVVADMHGAIQATLPAGDASWSSQDAILIGGGTEILQVRPDGSNLGRLSGGTFQSPSWAPNGTVFAFERGGAIWTATAPPLPPEPTPLDDATAVVNRFMQARLNKDASGATAYLDDKAKTAYTTGGLNLVVNGDPHLSRYYILTGEITGSQPDTARFVVRLVLTHGKLDVSDFEETLTLVRDPASKQFVVDQATPGASHELGKGAEVVNVELDPDAVKVTFDSDLDPATVTDAVKIVDDKGNSLLATASYANRVVTLSGLSLKEGGHYRLVVLTSLRDVQGNNVVAEYDLDLFGPALKKHAEHHEVVTASPSPSPSPGG